MPGRLMFFILIFALILFFIGFNLGDEFKCNINFGFTRLNNIPVFFPIFVSFVLGLLFSLPLVIKNKAGKKSDGTAKEKKPDKKQAKNDFSDSDDSPYNIIPGNDEKIKQDAAAAKERFLAKRRGNK